MSGVRNRDGSRSRGKSQAVASLGSEGFGPSGVGAGPAVGIRQRRDLAAESGFQDAFRLGQLAALGTAVERGQLVMVVSMRTDRQVRGRAGELRTWSAREQLAGQRLAVHGDLGPRGEPVQEPGLVGDRPVKERADDRHDGRGSRHRLQVDRQRR